MKITDDLRRLERRDWELLGIVFGILIALIIFTIFSYFYSEPIDENIWVKYTNRVLLIGFAVLSFLSCIYIAITKKSIQRLRHKLMDVEIQAQELKEINAMKTEFVSNVSHELRTPLASIKGFVSTLLETNVPETEYKKFLSIVDQQTDRLTNIIDDLLDLARLESGKTQLNFTPVNLLEVVELIKTEFHGKIQEKGLSLKIEISNSLLVKADKNALIHILGNLIDNATKFTPDGEVIVKAELWTDKKYIKCSIQDSGIGIEKEHLNKVFDKFYRIETAAHIVPGTGLGLAIVKDLVEKHNGKIWVESEKGVGSIFSFTIPIFAFAVSGVNS